MMSNNNQNQNRTYDAETNTYKDNNDTTSKEKKVKRDASGRIIEDTETTQFESNK